MLSFFPRDVLEELLDLVGSVSEGFLTYSSLRKVMIKFEVMYMRLKRRVSYWNGCSPFLVLEVRPFDYFSLFYTPHN